MNAYISLVYPKNRTDEQKEQWRKAALTFSPQNPMRPFICEDWYILLYEHIDKDENLHQIARINESKKENIHIKALRFLRAFKAFAPFVICSKPFFAEKVPQELLKIY